MMSQLTKRNFHTYLNFLIPECINATIKKLQIKAIKITKKQGVIDPEKVAETIKLSKQFPTMGKDNILVHNLILTCRKTT